MGRGVVKIFVTLNLVRVLEVVILDRIRGVAVWKGEKDQW